MISYETLNRIMKDRNVTKSDLTLILGISSRTVAKIAKGEKLSKATLEKIASFLGCDAEKLCREVSDNPILQVLRDEESASISGGLYHELQVRMTYNSNHIEGSMLSEEQTRMIYETNTIDVGDGIPTDDILETIHHFRAIDYVIDTAEDYLTEDIIKDLHFTLKHDTKDSLLPWFGVGQYKKRPNMVGGRETTKPKDVPAKMNILIDWFNSLPIVEFEDIVTFHAEFEKIHPFQDGNGRVGRLIALKECLHHGIVPFLIEDSKKQFYYRGLAEWDNDRSFLIDTCLDGQDTFKRLIDMLGFTRDKTIKKRD